MLELYRRIKHRREKLNMTQDALAKKAGYKSRTSIHKIELGLTDLSQSKIMEIADALATTPEYLIQQKYQIVIRTRRSLLTIIAP